MGVESVTYKGVWEIEAIKEENDLVQSIHPTNRKKGERLLGKFLTEG